MDLSAILAAARTVVAGTPELTGGVYYPPPAPTGLTVFPCAVIEAASGVNMLPGSFEGELAAINHRFMVNIFAAQGYFAESYGLAVTLLEAVIAEIEANGTLGGIVTDCRWSEYSVGKLDYAGVVHTGAALSLLAEEK